MILRRAVAVRAAAVTEAGQKFTEAKRRSSALSSYSATFGSSARTTTKEQRMTILGGEDANKDSFFVVVRADEPKVAE